MRLQFLPTFQHSATAATGTALKGGEFIIKDSNALETFIPEDFDEEQKMVMDMCKQFLDAEILSKC